MTHAHFNRKAFRPGFNFFVDDLLTELPALFKNDFNNDGRRNWVPVNVKESDNSYSLEVVAPGFDKSDFNVNLEKDLLTISAEKKEEVKEDSPKMIRREFTTRSFKRSFTLDEKIDATNIEASYINGVLTLQLPKKAEVKAEAKQITIQ